ncbi:hypothetical protein PybrP1_012521 [[Pythium] brassicae (nom. inval.)]|nr:hypothetical protein PybrP1_012521 [[Pythium] brassicae (nom. inval.)]
MATTDLSDELIWALDEHAGASARSLGPEPFERFGGSSGAATATASSAMAENDYVYGRATERIRASLAAEPLDYFDNDSDSGDGDSVVEIGADGAFELDDHPDRSERAAKPAPLLFDYNSGHGAGRSVSDDTDQSWSRASEQSALDSPPPSPLVGSSVRATTDLSDAAHHSYEQRIEATLTGSVGKHRRLEGSGSSGTAAESPTQELPAPPFTMDDIGYFDAHFGRELYLEQLSKSFLDGSGAKSLASYRMSSYNRMSMASDVIKQGWLVKRAGVVPSWRRRWFTLRRMPEGPVLTYARDNSASAPTKTIELSSTSRCLVRPAKLAREHEFRVITSTDSSRREFSLVGASNFDMTEWVCSIQSAINAGNKSTFEGSEDFQRIWNDAGIDGFLLRYGVRKCSSRNHLQTRVLELNFAEQTITNSRRGESLTTLHFSDVSNVMVASARPNNEEHGLVLEFLGRHRAWPIYLDTQEARDDLLGILQKIADKDVTGADLEQRRSRLLLKTGFMERKNVAADVRAVGLHATLKGRLFVCLYENCLVLYPEDGDTTARPWYVVTLKGMRVTCRDDKCALLLGRLALICASPEETRRWHHAVLAAVALPPEVAALELTERVKIRNAFHASVTRLRKLLKAKVQPEASGPPADHKAVELLMRVLWQLAFPGEAYTSNSDPRWLELGFQRGGPASDLRATGLLGLYCLIYFVHDVSGAGAFQRILARTRHGVSEGNLKNYPLAIACINVATSLTETLGFGHAGSHAAGCSPSAMKTYVHLLAQTVASTPFERVRTASVASARALSSFESWDDVVGGADNHVFEDIFCLLFPVLDMLFVEMGAGYMEFGQVTAAFQRRIGVIFDALPKSMAELAALAAEPCTDTLVDPILLGRAIK